MKTERQLKIAVTKAKNKMLGSSMTLAEKIELKKAVKLAEDELYNFKLNYFTNK